ncbi:protein TASOR 2 isoform X2 [Pseudophryne corroboree]|uniref:protein TASOR 2 isoform X2 n=1 Tax=Pseudophryne corroboree TaxID=495146 RepID=UPI00308207C8
MSVLQDIDMVQMTSPELYNVWKGQMHIQEQLVCDIALQSSSNCCIPAQLPYKLEIKEVIRLSELRKNLPDHIFHNTDSTGQEVCCERVYSSLYSVITTNVIGLELDKLLQLLKDHDLAVIKVLNDQGFLILVASSALKNHKGVGESDSSQLNALFLFPHTKLLAERGREECKFIRDDISLQISNLLPGLQYAYMETSQMRKNKNIYPDTLMERFFRKYAFLQRESQSPPEVVIEQSDSPSLFHGHESDITEKCGQLAYARLQFYFSSPVNFSVTLKKVSTLLSETAVSSNSDKYAKSGGHLVGHDPVASEAKLPLAVEAKVGSESPHGSNALQSIAKSSKKTPLKRSGRRRGKRGKRKLVHQTAPSSTETGENQTSNKRRKLLSEDQKQVGSSSKTTVKLTIDPYPQRRKRGAEILTAAFVQDEKIKTSQKIVLSKRIEEFRSTTPKSKVVKRRPRKILAPEDSFRVPDRPPKRKASEPGKRNELKNKSESYKKPVERHREKIGRPFKKLEKVKNVATEQIDRFSKPNVDLGLDAKKTSLFTPSPDDSMIEKRINMYESDALNLLADLALNSFCSENPYYIQGECVAHKDESETKEKADSGDNICPVEHPPKDCKHSILPSSASKEPEQILEAEKDKPKDGSNANQGNITSQRHIEYSEKQTPQKFSVAAAKAKARSNTTSKISLEHSYSQLPLDDISDIIFSKEKNEQPVQSIVEPTVTTPTTEVVVEKSPKVFLPAKILFVASEKLSLPVVKVKPRTVTKLEDKFVITFNWDAKYDFDLDSKFTSDPLEKTINRALHGEWNHHLKEKVEDVKIILHMWLALFYSKPNKQLNCSSRKVVEHSNPAKYVSINTVLDPFELYEIVESDAIELCAADTENSNAVVGRKIETSSQGKMQESSLLHKLEKNQNKTRPEDLSIEYSIPTKVSYKGNEHEYSKKIPIVNETQRSGGTEHVGKILNKVAEENKENAKLYESANSPQVVSHTQSESSTLQNVRLPQEKHESTDLTKLRITWDYSCAENKNIVNAEVPATGVLNIDITNENLVSIDLSNQNDGHPKHFDKAEAEPYSYERKNLLDARMQLAQNVHLNVDKPISTMTITENKDLLKASVIPVFDVNEVKRVESTYLTLQNAEDKELGKTDQNLINNHSACELSEGSSTHIKPINSPVCMDIRSNMDGKVLGSIQSQAKECEKYRKVDESEHLTTSDVVSQNIMQQKALELTESTASSVVIDLDCLSNSSQVDKVGSAQSVNTTPEDLLERVSEHSSDKLGDSESKENSKLITNGVHEITDVLTVYSGYSQENEHSYVSKVTAEGTKKPELRITTVKTSYAEHTDTTDLKSSECENVDETGKGSPESTPEQTYNREEQTTSTTVENSVLTLHNDNASIPEKIDGVEEREQVMAVPAQSTLLSSVLCVENTNSLSVASADTGTKVVKAMNSNVIDTNHLLSGHMEEKSSKICGEVTFGKDKPLIGHEEMPLVITNHSVIESVNSEGNSDTLAMDVSALGEKHDLQSDIHSKELSERSSPLILHPSPDNKSIENNISLAGALSERNNLPGTVVEEMHVHTLLENIETLNSCDMVVQSSETLDICEEITLKNKTHTVAGNSELSNSNVTILESDRLSLSSDPLVSKCSAIEVEQLPVETQQNDIPSDALHVSHPLQVTETVPKDLAHSSKNANNNRREILSKLKLICLGSVVGQQAHSISEDDVLLVYEKIGRVSTEEHNQTVDPKNIGGNVQIHDGNTSTPDNTGIMEEDTVSDKAAAVEDHLLPEIPNTTLTGEPGPLEKLVAIPAQNSCISPSTDDFTANTEKDLDQEKSDICFIVNTGSISKEQYDRWSETSDEDIEFIQAYKEPLSHQENLSFQKERHELSSSFEKLTFDHDPTQSKKPKYFKGQSCPSTMLYEADDDPSNGNHGNVIVTKSISDNGKTLHTAHRESRHTGMCNLDNLFSNRRMVSDNITQNTLDLEHLRFMCKLKAVLRKSTAEKHVCEPPFQTMFESKRIPGCSSSTAKNRSPLVITVHCPHRRRDLERLDRRYPSQPYYNDEIWNRPVCYSRTTKKVRTRRSSPFHFSRLRYESTPQKSNSDIAVILKECVQSNHLKLSSVGLGNSAVDRTSASQLAEETGCQARRTSVPFSKSHPVKNIISELCQSLHSRLRSVGRETRKENIYFYICETSDDTFFSSTKSLMTKDGHTQTEPQGFCRGEHTESSMLLVIIRNEDISSTINKIPCLLQLRLLPNVTFAGVDAPEDITESTYQELFQAGGFVVSDKTVLENITLGKLKELLTVMEKMNRTSAWKWLIHYRENRKLKDDKRVESVSQIKTSLLKSYYQSNIIEILPYHQCDKLSNEVSDDLACLLSVQSQRIHSRLAVYLTDTPCTMAEEFEQNGILVYDVDTFIRKIQKVDAQLQASCWS